MAGKPLSSTRLYQAPQIILGILLIACWWPIAWLQVKPFSDYYFFPLWLGYILTVDGLVDVRTGTSLWSRDKLKFALLFISSVPFWWIFEWLNGYIGNWHYRSPIDYSSIAYLALASIAFSTVVPAVLEAGELMSSFGIGERLPSLPAWKLKLPSVLLLHLLGWSMLILVLLFPHYAFALTWLSVFFIIEPINFMLGQRSIGRFVYEGTWTALWNVMIGTVMTGFFWEMWNYFSLPKWTYTVPFVGFLHVFEMPILGYTGYLPFGLEVFSIFGLLFMVFFRQPQDYAVVSHERSVRK